MVVRSEPQSIFIRLFYASYISPFIHIELKDTFTIIRYSFLISAYPHDTIPKSYAAIQKHLEECGFEDVGGDFTYIPNDMKEVTPEQRETLDKMIERLEEFDDVQTVYTNMQPEEGE